MQIYIYRNNQQLGPFTEAEIKAQLASGATSLQDNVWWEGQANWIPLGQSSLMATLAPTPPGSPPMAPSPLPGTPSTAPVTAAVPQTSNLAIWALVCGCLSLVCGLFACIPAIILGHLALCEIKKNPIHTGRGLALAGLIIGYVMTLLSIGAIVFYMSLAPAILEHVKEAEKKSEALTPGSSTNAPEQATPAPTATNSDQSTNAPATTNSSDSSANSSTPSTNAPASSTNAAPMTQ
jgi:peptidyl-prolyl cis-trans isomerase B (cyclophilin B)